MGAPNALPDPERIALVSPSPGTERSLALWRFGRRGARPKAYLQAALHADELPGVLVLRLLAERLAAADAAGEVRGEVVVVPVANPIGLAQYVLGRSLGRHALAGGNFNRGYPDLAAGAAERLAGRLGADPAANVVAVRTALGAALAAWRPLDEADRLRHTLLALAVDADIALDLHCDAEAVLHLYTGTPLWPGAADLSAELGSRATLLAERSGGHPFDEALSGPWWALAARFPEHPIPPACLAATVELRGERDLGRAEALADAEALVRFLRRRGVLAGDPGPLPAPRCEATPLAGVDMVRAPRAGLVLFEVEPGQQVAEGERLGELLDPLGGRSELRARTAGVLFARAGERLARPGQVLAKVAGREPLPGREAGALLED